MLLVVTFTAWAFYFILGLPFDYFLTWSVAERILLSLVTMFAVLPCVAFFVLLLIGANYLKTSLWFAFYASVFVFILDYIVVGLIQGSGIGFLKSHWTSTIGYLYVWISIPFVGYAMESQDRQ